jgi:hypothetical protein
MIEIVHRNGSGDTQENTGKETQDEYRRPVGFEGCTGYGWLVDQSQALL